MRNNKGAQSEIYAAREVKPVNQYLKNAYTHVIREMSEVDELIRNSVASPKPLLSEVTGHFLAAGGKRIRPALVLLAGKCCGGGRKRLVRLAAALEFIHMASLVHDDIIDRAVMRRNSAAVNAKWGTHVAVLLGDYFYASALKLAAPLGEQVNRGLAEIVCDLVEGEFGQLQNRHREDVTEESYLDTISRKTARFISLCCRLGAEVGNSPPQLVRGLSSYGYYTGMAYQIIDDVLDITGHAPVCPEQSEDLKNGVLTLPVIHALNHGEGGEKFKELLIRDGITVGEMREILQYIHRSGSVEYSVGKAREYIAKARRSLRGLPAGNTRDALDSLAEYIFHRVSGNSEKAAGK